MTDREVARDKAARLLKKQGSVSSVISNEGRQLPLDNQQRKPRSMSTVSFMDEPHEDYGRPALRLENTYQLTPNRKFPDSSVHNILRDVLESYLAEEKYEPDLCKQMTKTISEVVKARVKDLRIPRYKVICLVHIGQLNEQGIKMGSRCLWDSSSDTFSTYEFRNNSMFAIATVYGIYYE